MSIIDCRRILILWAAICAFAHAEESALQLYAKVTERERQNLCSITDWMRNPIEITEGVRKTGIYEIIPNADSGLFIGAASKASVSGTAVLVTAISGGDLPARILYHWDVTPSEETAPLALHMAFTATPWKSSGEWAKASRVIAQIAPDEVSGEASIPFSSLVVIPVEMWDEVERDVSLVSSSGIFNSKSKGVEFSELVRSLDSANPLMVEQAAAALGSAGECSEAVCERLFANPSQRCRSWGCAGILGSVNRVATSNLIMVAGKIIGMARDPNTVLEFIEGAICLSSALPRPKERDTSLILAIDLPGMLNFRRFDRDLGSDNGILYAMICQWFERPDVPPKTNSDPSIADFEKRASAIEGVMHSVHVWAKLPLWKKEDRLVLVEVTPTKVSDFHEYRQYKYGPNGGIEALGAVCSAEANGIVSRLCVVPGVPDQWTYEVTVSPSGKFHQFAFGLQEELFTGGTILGIYDANEASRLRSCLLIHPELLGDVRTHFVELRAHLDALDKADIGTFTADMIINDDIITALTRAKLISLRTPQRTGVLSTALESSDIARLPLLIELAAVTLTDDYAKDLIPTLDTLMQSRNLKVVEALAETAMVFERYRKKPGALEAGSLQSHLADYLYVRLQKQLTLLDEVEKPKYAYVRYCLGR